MKKRTIALICLWVVVILFIIIVFMPSPYWYVVAVLQWCFMLLELIALRVAYLEGE